LLRTALQRDCSELLFKEIAKNCSAPRLLRTALQRDCSELLFNEIAKNCSSTEVLRETGRISKEANELGKA
jgi:protein required for attachment to host cells